MTTFVDWPQFDGVLFDLDGVITPTAELHERAWAELFAAWDFSPADYLAFVDGKPRYDGVASFLNARDISLPWGGPSDPPGDDTVCALGNRKNAVFNEVLERDGIVAYPGSLAVMDLLDQHDVGQAIVSSSRNAQTVLAAAGLAERFRVVVDGVVAAERAIAGKPAPDMFQLAASLLGVPDSACAVVEDAVAGVTAGITGDFALVLGIDRGGNRGALNSAGAHLVVDDLADTLSPPVHCADSQTS